MHRLALLVGALLCVGLSMPLDGFAAGPEGVAPDAAADSRLVLQVGMLVALLYVAFVCVWLSRTRRGHALEHVRQRVRALWAAAVARPAAVVRARSLTRRPGAAESPWTCAIAWKRGRVRSRFQAVSFTPGDPKRRVVAESTGVRWPPKDARNPPTRELEAALGALFASIVATGWEPAQPDGSWSERRFVWRGPGAPPATLRPSSRPPVSPDGRRRSRGPAVPTPCTASPGAAGTAGHRARR